MTTDLIVPLDVAELRTALVSEGGEAKLDELFAEIEKRATAEVVDVSTASGRDACRSLAYRVTRSKTLVDEARKAATEDLRQRVNDINARGKDITVRLGALAAKVRLPLTEWEEAEEARKAAHIARLKQITGMILGNDSATVEAQITEIRVTPLDEATWEEFLPDARAAHGSLLTRALERLDAIRAREAQEAELARLRAEERKRAAREAVEKAEREALERRAREAEERAAEAERKAQEAAMREQMLAEREERAKREAEERATREAERLKREKEDAVQRAKMAMHARDQIITAMTRALDASQEPFVDVVVDAIIAGSIPHVRYEIDVEEVRNG